MSNFFGGQFFGGGFFGAVTTAATTSVSGVRRRKYVDIRGRLVEVRSIDEAEELLTELKKEEKAQEVDRKKLTLSIKRYTVDLRTRGRKPERPEVIEKRMDDRQQRLEALYAEILKRYEQSLEEDEEEVLLLS